MSIQSLARAIFSWGSPKTENEELAQALHGKKIVRFETRRRRSNVRCYCLEVEDGTNVLLGANGIEIREKNSSPTVWQQTSGE